MDGWSSPVHAISGDRVRWSRGNLGEAFQGVQTPLGWTFTDRAMEAGVRRAFGALGVFGRREIPPPASPDEKIAAPFYGHAAGNVTIFHRIGEALPGTSGDALVEQMYGERRPPTAKSGGLAARTRYPVIAVKLPWSVVRFATAVAGIRRAQAAWWRHTTLGEAPATRAEASAVLGEAADRLTEVVVVHSMLSILGQALAEQIETLAGEATGDRDLAAELMTGYGGLDEIQIMTDIWSTARDELSFDELVSRHGYHGLDEGNLTSRSWREDPEPLHRLVESYRGSAVDDPRLREARQRTRREDAQRRLLAALPVHRRPAARLLLRLARWVIPLREVGKSATSLVIDTARYAARSIGTHLVAEGNLRQVDDVFFFTYDELTAGHPGSPELVEARRADHRRFQGLRVPAAWTGNPPATPEPEAGQEAEPEAEHATGPANLAAPMAERVPVGELAGIGVVGEVVTGRARVAHDPSRIDLEDGDVLVCPATDPSWTPHFLIAAALVIDTGGAMSHAAIVARELGVTCVINTGTGTRDIPDLATITVDGRTGHITIHHDTAHHDAHQRAVAAGGERPEGTAP